MTSCALAAAAAVAAAVSGDELLVSVEESELEEIDWFTLAAAGRRSLVRGRGEYALVS